MSNACAAELAYGIALVTYDFGDTRRSSVWVREHSRWLLRYHQGHTQRDVRKPLAIAQRRRESSHGRTGPRGLLPRGDQPDTRFDGWFYTAVHTTGIYCRPSCPAITPKPGNVDFYRTAAAADRGLPRCKRCRPDASPAPRNGTYAPTSWRARCD